MDKFYRGWRLSQFITDSDEEAWRAERSNGQIIESFSEQNIREAIDLIIYEELQSYIDEYNLYP